jgi:hypothetical protein
MVETPGFFQLKITISFLSFELNQILKLSCRFSCDDSSAKSEIFSPAIVKKTANISFAKMVESPGFF